MTQSAIRTRKMVSLGMLSAVAFAVMYLSKQIPIRIEGFLSMDFKDIIIVITGFIFGPLSAAVVSIVVSVIEMVTISSTGFYGLIMNIISTCALACTAAIIYKRNRTMQGAIIGLVVGVIAMTAIMLLWNYIILPMYNPGITREFVAPMLLTVFLPFNLIKGALNATISVLLYKPVVQALRKANLAPEREGGQPKNKRLSIGVLAVGLFVLATLVLLFLVMAKVL